MNPLQKMRPSKWQFISHVSYSTCATRLEGRTWRGLQLRREATTRTTVKDAYGKSKTIYYVKGQRKEFKTMVAFISYLKSNYSHLTTHVYERQ